MIATVTKLNAKSAPKPLARGESKLAKQKARNQFYSACAIGGVVATATGLSLTHLAHGVEFISGSGVIESIAMAVVIDCGMIGSEFAMLTNPGNKQISKYATPVVWGSLLMSAVGNALAFAQHANSGIMTAAACVMGVMVPAGIYCLMRVGSAQYLGIKK